MSEIMIGSKTGRSGILSELIDAAIREYEAQTPEQKAEHDRAQRESFLRSFRAGDYESRASADGATD